MKSVLYFTIILFSQFSFASKFDERWSEAERVRQSQVESRLNQHGQAKAAEMLAAIPAFARQMKEHLIEGSIQCNEGDASMNRGAYYSCDFQTVNLACRVKSGTSRGGIVRCNVIGDRYSNCWLADASWNFTCVDGANRQISRSLRQR